MSTLKNIRIKYDDEIKKFYVKDFEIIEKLPEIERTKKYNNEVVKINNIEIDCEIAHYEHCDYDYYEIKYIDYQYFNEENGEDIEEYAHYDYVAILKEESES